MCRAQNGNCCMCGLNCSNICRNHSHVLYHIFMDIATRVGNKWHRQCFVKVRASSVLRTLFLCQFVTNPTNSLCKCSVR